MRGEFLTLIVAALISTAAAADPLDVFPPIVDGIEYRMVYGLTPVPNGWADGMSYSMRTRLECQRRVSDDMLARCLVRKKPDLTS